MHGPLAHLNLAPGHADGVGLAVVGGGAVGVGPVYGRQNCVMDKSSMEISPW